MLDTDANSSTIVGSRLPDTTKPSCTPEEQNAPECYVDFAERLSQRIRLCESRTGVDATGWVKLSAIKVAGVNAGGTVALRDGNLG